MEFIVGKWYENPRNIEGSEITWAKFTKWERGRFHFSEWIYKGEYLNQSTYWEYGESNRPYSSINIEEIQQYLPLYHPDLVTITNENMNYLIPILKRHGIQ